MLYLVEHFYSIQGEGAFVGTPSLFFRFGGCNMRCVGFGCHEIAPDGTDVVGCDTIYAVDKQHFSKDWVKISKLQELIAILNMYELPEGVDVVFTGGEPLIYANDPLFVEFLEYLDRVGHRITFETNGSLNVDFEKYPVYKKAVFALSVKLSNSLESESKRIVPKVIANIAHNADGAFFKFSIDKASITLGLEEEIDSICALAPQLKVYCMPLGGNKEEIEKNTQPLIEFCKTKGYNFSDRLHIRIWDANKGV